jgi:hypothetical protein
MKKLLALLLVFLMVFSAVACATTDNPQTSSPPASTPTPADNSPSGGGDVPDAPSGGGPNGSPFADTTAAAGCGLYKDGFDYSSMPRYKVAFLSMSWASMVERMSNAYKEWADRTNCDYVGYDAGGDADAFMTQIEPYAAMGYHGVILNVFSEDGQRADEICKENGLQWLPNSARPIDENGTLVHPFINYDYPKWGGKLMDSQIEWAKENLADFDPATTKVVFVTFSAALEFNGRQEGWEAAWYTAYPEYKDNVIIADLLASGVFSAEGAYDLVATQMAKFPETKAWIIGSVVDFLTPGAVRAAEAYKVEDITCVGVCGGEDLIALWIDGQETCWRLAEYNDMVTGCNLTFNGLYALMSGWATPETLWSDYINHAAGEEYASILVATSPLTHDNFEQVAAYSDHYNGFNWYPQYKWDGQFTFPILDAPANYN